MPPLVQPLPSVVEVDLGKPAALIAVASGTAPLGYQWQRDGVDIPGATDATYVIAEAGPADAGRRFRVRVRNVAGETLSNEALLKVNGVAPMVVAMLQIGVAAPGQRVVITTRFAGNPPFTYQWLRNDQPIAGAAGTTDSTTLQFTTDVLTSADDGVRFALTITTADGAVRSPEALIAVVGPSRVAAGGSHSLARSSSGILWAWGDNQFGQLGLGSTASSSSPAVVSTLAGVKAIAAGTDHSLALKDDGTVWAWGRNTHGALGDGTQTDRHAPQPVNGLAGVIAIAAGDGRSFAVRSDGSLWGWGENSTGALGTGDHSDVLSPVRVGQTAAGFSDIVAISSGARHSLALRADGHVFVMGEVAVTPAGGPAILTVPTGVSGLTSISGIAAGNGYSLALDINGKIWSWGVNGSGQLGLGDTTPRALPQWIPSTQAGSALPPTIRLAAGHEFAALRALDGSVRSWGADASGQLGDGGSSTGALAPTGAAILSGAVLDIAAGKAHALAVRADGSVYSWGSNASGQLGLGTSEAQRAEPAQVPGLNLN